MKKIQPINNNVLLKLEDPTEDKTPGGIIIPDTAKEKSQEGKVVALPADSDIDLSVGDVVLYKGFSGTEINFEGESYLLILSDDILAKFVEVDSI
ncbi:MAG: co-chaperone GroES [Thermodesulfobacteriota bacterium]|jgi:chaperonin GroES|nr:co-chaperone GroES [Thermodesulfobacteriota bacterium]